LGMCNKKTLVPTQLKVFGLAHGNVGAFGGCQEFRFLLCGILRVQLENIIP